MKHWFRKFIGVKYKTYVFAGTTWTGWRTAYITVDIDNDKEYNADMFFKTSAICWANEPKEVIFHSEYPNKKLSAYHIYTQA